MSVIDFSCGDTLLPITINRNTTVSSLKETFKVISFSFLVSFSLNLMILMQNMYFDIKEMIWI